MGGRLWDLEGGHMIGSHGGSKWVREARQDKNNVHMKTNPLGKSDLEHEEKGIDGCLILHDD